MTTKVHSESVRVLVAEDDENLGEVLARGLREHGYVVDLVLAGGGVRIETVRGVGYRITPA